MALGAPPAGFFKCIRCKVNGLAGDTDDGYPVSEMVILLLLRKYDM